MDIEKLFGQQIKTLRDCGCPEQIIQMLERQKSLVLRKAKETLFGKENIPFIPVIPLIFRSVYDLINMVSYKYGQKEGYVDPLGVRPVNGYPSWAIPNKPYYIYDVDNGEALRNKSPGKDIETLRGRSRLSLTAAEVMALGLHDETRILSQQGLLALGSFYENFSSPALVLGDPESNGIMRPCLYLVNLDEIPANLLGSPSCKSRGTISYD